MKVNSFANRFWRSYKVIESVEDSQHGNCVRIENPETCEQDIIEDVFGFQALEIGNVVENEFYSPELDPEIVWSKDCRFAVLENADDDHPVIMDNYSDAINAINYLHGEKNNYDCFVIVSINGTEVCKIRDI